MLVDQNKVIIGQTRGTAIDLISGFWSGTLGKFRATLERLRYISIFPPIGD